jgi:carboxylesterase type B
VPHARWDGIRDALAYGATSPQPDRGITLIPEPVIAGDNELNLNVFTPDLVAVGLPVLVWIHGGGFTGGCSASPWYRGGPFARDGVVLVSINYRLGAEGFLEVPGMPANRAVRDWIRALEWVQENIAAFGGDPHRVTIGGQSAGGAACATLLAVPAARGLYRAAACMSGGQALMQTPEGVRAEAIATPAQRRHLAALGALCRRRVVTEEPLTAAASLRHGEVSLLAGATAHEFNAAWLAADWITAAIAAAGLAQAGGPAAAVAAYVDQAGSLPSGGPGCHRPGVPRPRPAAGQGGGGRFGLHL